MPTPPVHLPSLCVGLSETGPGVPTLPTENVEGRHGERQEHHPQNRSWGTLEQLMRITLQKILSTVL